MTPSDLQELRQLIRSHRQATLAVSANDEPFTAMVSYVEDENLSGFLIHLSDLSPHKGQLMANPKCSLLIAIPDRGEGEVMSLARISIQGIAAKILKDTDDYEQSKARFLAKLPTSEIMFTLRDFDLFRIAPMGGRFIAGFGRVFEFTTSELILPQP